MTFIVVGDVDPAEVRGRIETTFASMRNPAHPGANPDLGKIHQPEGLETAVFSDKEVSSTDVSLTLVRPHVEKPDTAATRAERHAARDRALDHRPPLRAHLQREKLAGGRGLGHPSKFSSTRSNSARSASPRRMIAGRKWCPSSSRNSAAPSITGSPNRNSPRQNPICSTPTNNRSNKRPPANPKPSPPSSPSRSTTKRCSPLRKPTSKSPNGALTPSTSPPATRRSRLSGKPLATT